MGLKKKRQVSGGQSNEECALIGAKQSASRHELFRGEDRKEGFAWDRRKGSVRTDWGISSKRKKRGLVSNKFQERISGKKGKRARDQPGGDCGGRQTLQRCPS